MDDPGHPHENAEMNSSIPFKMDQGYLTHRWDLSPGIAIGRPGIQCGSPIGITWVGAICTEPYWVPGPSDVNETNVNEVRGDLKF